MWLLLRCGPVCPANEAVDCVTVLWLVQRELVASSAKFVAAILQPVWPRDQYLPPGRRAHLVGSVCIDKLPAVGGVGAKSATNLDDHCLLIKGSDRELLTRWCGHRCLPSASCWQDRLLENVRSQARVIMSFHWSKMRKLGDDHVRPISARRECATVLPCHEASY